jgi:drug/metabolite transporter (DMT)-like permease
VWHWSIAYTSVENATLLANLAPVVVTAYAWVVLKERVGPRFLLGLLFALAGAGLLVRASLGVGGQHLLGDLLGVITAFFYAGYLLTVKELRRYLPTARLMGASSLVTCLALLVLTLLSRDSFRPGSLRGWLVLIALAWFGQVLGQGLIAFGLKRLPASFSSVTLLVQPAAAGLLAWLILGESLSWWQALGGVAVIAGILLARGAVRQGETQAAVDGGAAGSDAPARRGAGQQRADADVDPPQSQARPGVSG